MTISLLTACNLPSKAATPTPDLSLVETLVASTFQALTPGITPTATFAPPTPTPPVIETPTPTYPLTATLTSSAGQTPTQTSTPLPGSIAGGIYAYPYGNIPALVIVAYHQEKPYYWWWITAAGSTYYTMNGYIPPGQYQVVAYDAAGHAGGCTTIVTVKSDQTVNCDITDWSGSYRSKPADVPTP